MEAAETWARDGMADGTYVETHVQRDINGVISVRALRYVALAVASGAGDWISVTDDGA
jgi:hypothetical protein